MGLRSTSGTVILFALLGVGVTACSSAPSSAASGLCGSVVPSPPPNAAIAVSESEIKAGENSGYPDLDRDAKNWLTALHQHDETANQVAQRHLVADCSARGIPLGTFTAP
jgi:hypothetical protein